MDDLEDISNSFQFNEFTYLSDDQNLELHKVGLHLLDDFVRLNPCAVLSVDFEEYAWEYLIENLTVITEPISSVFKFDGEDGIENELESIANGVWLDFFETLYPLRQDSNGEMRYQSDIDEVLNKLNNIPQAVQRTDEWYEFRYSMITASSASDIFGSQACKNGLIYEKCKPYDKNAQESTNFGSAMHHGQKYEPLTIKIFEKMHNVTVGQYGCIQHDIYKFLGASPDGIITNRDSPLYGCMLEIKNVVSREITGIPITKYWVQMQLQMEVCNLNNCKLLETKFTEYENIDAYNNEPDKTVTRGVICMLMSASHIYEYYICNSEDDIEKQKIDLVKWKKETLSDPARQFVQYIYWKLDVWSCVHVERNTRWFEDNVEEMTKFWDIIKSERLNGYEHRIPKKRQPIEKKNADPVPNSAFCGKFVINKLEYSSDQLDSPPKVVDKPSKYKINKIADIDFEIE